jgi:cytochrome P450
MSDLTDSIARIEAARAAPQSSDDVLSQRLRSLDEVDAARPVELHAGNMAALAAAGLEATQTVVGVLGVIALHTEQHAEQLAAAG